MHLHQWLLLATAPWLPLAHGTPQDPRGNSLNLQGLEGALLPPVGKRKMWRLELLC